MSEGNEKYELTSEYIEVYGNKKLYRIRALKNFGGIRAGDLGGYVESESNLSHGGNCWVDDNAYVADNARVVDDAYVGDNARVTDRALVTGEARVTDRALVTGEARVTGKTWVCDDAYVADNARVVDNAYVGDNARVTDRALVTDSARVNSEARVSKTSIFISGLHYKITITDTHIQVGCQCKTLEEWKSMTLEDLEIQFGRQAVEFHDKYWKAIEHLAIGHQQ